jgi:hypothetical protein
MGAGGTPSAASAVRAQPRPVVNSRRRLSTARAITTSSSGNSATSGRSENASADATPAGRISSITAMTLSVGQHPADETVVRQFFIHMITHLSELMREERAK